MANRLLTSSDLDVAGTPVDGDKLKVPPQNKLDVTINTDNQQNMAEIVVTRGYTKSFGKAGNAIRANTDMLGYFGSGSMHFASKDDGASPEVTDTVVVAAANTDAIVVLTRDGASHANGGTFQDLRFFRGTITCGGTSFFHASAVVDVGYVNSQRNDAVVDIVNGANLPTLNIDGGTTTCNTPVTAADVTNGKLTQIDQLITTLHIRHGGHVDYQHTTATTIVVHSGGTLELSGKEDFKTITTLVLHAGSRLISAAAPNEAGGPTVTNLTDYRNVAA